MNEDNTHDPSATDAGAPAPVGPAAAAASSAEQTPTAAGHGLPAVFSSAGGAATSTPGTPAPVGPAAQSMSAPAGGTPAPDAHVQGPGAAFGVPHVAAHTTPPPYDPHAQPTQPFTGTAPFPGAAPFGAVGGAGNPEAEKPRNGARFAAIVVAAALVGGIAGFGGGALLNAIDEPRSTGAAQGPETVTVNNPGSVNETTAVAAKALPSVVTIEVAGSNAGGSGSGVIISDDGYVLTNTHVVTLGGSVADPTIRVVSSDGRIYDATIVGTDPIYDLAVIKLEGASGLTPITFADSSALNVGDTTIALGAPLGLENSVTTGVVSALNRSIQIASAALPDSSSGDSGGQSPDGEGESPFQFDIPGQGQQSARTSISIAVIQTDAAINHGNSGGALVDSKGELIGINVAIASSGGSEQSGSIGLGFSIPSNIAKRVADEIISDGAATHGLLGASVRNAAGVEGTDFAGAYIAEIVSGGAADEGGLAAGDIVTEFNGVPITDATDLTAQVRAAAAGSAATLTYVRGDQEYEIEVTLGALGS